VASRIVEALLISDRPIARALRHRRMARLRGVCRAFWRVVPVVQPTRLRQMYGMVRSHALFRDTTLIPDTIVHRCFVTYSLTCGRSMCRLQNHMHDADFALAAGAVRTPCAHMVRTAVRLLWHALYRTTHVRWEFRNALQHLHASAHTTPVSREHTALVRALDDDTVRRLERDVFRWIEMRRRTIPAWTESV